MDRCNELCTKEATGYCALCEELAERDRFERFWFRGGLFGALMSAAKKCTMNHWRVVWRVGVAVAFLIIALLVGYRVWHLDFSRDIDIDNGTYYWHRAVTAWIQALGVLLAAGAFCYTYWKDRNTRWQLAFDMDREWGSMLEDRTSAAVLVFAQPKQTLDVLDREVRDREVRDGKVEVKKVAELWAVIRYFQRLALAVKHDQINLKLVPDLFGDDFTWWYILCFEPQLKPIPPPGWESWKHIDWLNTWLESNADPHDRARWKERAALSLRVAR